MSALNLSCPWCHSAPGEPCTYPWGEPLGGGRAHPSRTEAVAS